MKLFNLALMHQQVCSSASSRDKQAVNLFPVLVHFYLCLIALIIVYLWNSVSVTNLISTTFLFFLNLIIV